MTQCPMAFCSEVAPAIPVLSAYGKHLPMDGGLMSQPASYVSAAQLWQDENARVMEHKYAK